MNSAIKVCKQANKEEYDFGGLMYS